MYQVTDLILDIEMDFEFFVAENVTIYLDLTKNLQLKLVGHTNDAPGIKIKLAKDRIAIAALEPILTKVIDDKFKDGISINGILE